MSKQTSFKEFVVPRRLRVGVVSDSQLTPYRHKDPTTFERNLLAACRTMHTLGCGMILFAGDICNRASKKAYGTYKHCIETAFCDDKPIVMSIMGNHDYYLRPFARRLFERCTGQSPLSHYVVNGWHFIAASPDSSSMHDGYVRARDWLERELCAAEADGTERPVFVIVHNAPRDTVYGSDRWGDDSLTGVFDRHPRAVVFAGHTHYALTDPRSFWQGGYTVFNTQSLSYVEMEKGRANGSVPPLAYSAPMGYVMDLSDDRIEVLRYNMMTGKELPGKKIVLPADSAPALSPCERDVAPPRFSRLGGSFSTGVRGTELRFPRAERVQHYELAFSDGTVQTYFSDAYLGDAATGEEESLTVFGMKEGVYDVVVTAVGAFGERSRESIRIAGVRVLFRRYRRKLAPEIWY